MILSAAANVPEPNTGFVAVAAGEHHSLGLKASGIIEAWGGNYDGQCDVPEPNGGFVAVAAGWEHSLGLKSNGSIVAWGMELFWAMRRAGAQQRLRCRRGGA